MQDHTAGHASLCVPPSVFLPDPQLAGAARKSLLLEVCRFSTMASGQVMERFNSAGLYLLRGGSRLWERPQAKGPLCPGIESTGHSDPPHRFLLEPPPGPDTATPSLGLSITMETVQECTPKDLASGSSGSCGLGKPQCWI